MSSHDIITAVPLAFDESDGLDLAGCRRILDYVAASGVQGALVLGTTGEFPALSIEERNAVARLSVEVLTDIRVIVHVGAASRYEVTQLIAGARAAGAKEIAVLTPYYLPAHPDEVYSFFRDVVTEADGLDVYVYMFEARTGIPVDQELLLRLSTLPGVVGVKVSGEALGLITSFRSELPEEFRIYTGSDGDFARAGAAGADGVISGVASAFSRPFVRMRDALIDEDEARIASIQPDIDEAVAAIDGSPARMRAVHRIAGHNVGGRRMPIQEPDEVTVARLRRAVARFH
ncbi:4-hydroxy-tetrahydrodipicolinate synthase [Pseudoclavibacter sp. JAI123]|uniref:dihydrodipicolinate synthase family protein n=1 Tax=Pseudoclavibacter sp. JAI123 TaxID=2723065 RepID=UPI0015CC21A6|nr:dihydrodipicolinate synthase family protein [Pseudoclavibacter sp. JAI123]NYF14283.1 4-hydroxy-tetrahydrodipicolinate synthase [Pseudoclavibacter sp. JAI123]